jgi:hypothetical protein
MRQKANSIITYQLQKMKVQFFDEISKLRNTGACRRR